ncbi:similar to subunit A of phenylphosphate synthetase and phosphoenolpyruvate synthase [Aromatoleum aromaticum EbN1]|uniref:Similar to subunit A of phenylphosphate synthetase and phosphoenolpyruvate synthase n=1 Tax=Aromatoleum aromaticum (strain DSM 19018 / LMG 30748 / EbN1) TaxID=76114 RepID=Q5NZV7_AROAE|nr:similar to subunit A of phenylphosphate synthetase and phosphoenolpyruvate synthase [Aromatoleum aromaticum EbN1]
MPAGAEGWQRMYPYFLVSQPEGQPAEDSRFWFADSMHWSRAVHPFDSIGAEAVYYGAGVNSARSIALPSALGLDVRMVNGYVYICPLPVTDPAEIERRLVLFQERAGFYYKNWDDLYARWQEKMLVAVRRMKALKFEPLPEFEPLEVVTEGRGCSVSWDLVENYHRLINDFFLVWQYHFEMLGLGYGAYLVFFGLCKQAFPEIEDQTIARMVAGVEGIAFRPDDELRRLAKLAVELGLGEVLDSRDSPDEIFAALKRRTGGERWIAEFEAARDPWFDYFAEYGFMHDQETWNGNLVIPLQGIARYVGLLQAGEEIDRPVARLQAEQDEIAGEYRALLTPAEATKFDEALGLSRAVFPFIEEHNIYVEHWSHAVFWEKVRELGQVFVKAGFFKETNDLYYLNRFELDQALFDLVESWAIGVPARGVQHWHAEIAERRKIMTALRSASPAPAYGIPPKEVTDPFAIMNYGVTTERVADWLDQTAGSNNDGQLKGIPVSPGVVEGLVRVIRHEDELSQLLPGEILVAQITAPSWASAFSVVSGVVTDIGGMMSHAAIICREYAMPAVVSTGFATTRLKTGQRVRIDGRKGTVTPL